MAVRQKQKVLDTIYAHFKEFELPLDIEYKNYAAIVGAREAVHAISVKRSFKAWKYILHALKKNYPDLLEEPKPEPAPKPALKPAPKPKAPSKPATAEKKSEE
jgi:hypothetical protein